MPDDSSLFFNSLNANFSEDAHSAAVVGEDAQQRQGKLLPLLTENNELVSIFVASTKTATGHSK